MKVFETKKKVNVEAEQKKDREQLIEFINALARTTDRAMIKSAKEKQIETFAYVDVIGRIGEYADNGQYKVAYDMLLQVASILEADAKTLIESLPLLDDEAIAVFMEYYAEYIVDTHLIDILLEIPEDEEEEWEEVPLEDVLDEAYRTIKEIFCGEVKTDERSEDNRHM